MVRKILVVKLGGLGDVFLSTIVIDSLKQAYPAATLHYLVEKAGGEAIAHDPRVDSVFVFDKARMSSLAAIRHVRAQKYDVVIDLFGNPRSAILTFLSGAKQRVGLDYGWRRHLYSIVGNGQRESLHGAEVNLQALEAMGVPIAGKRLTFPLAPADTRYAADFWADHDLSGAFVIGILPAGSWPAKRCDPAKFAQIATALAAKHRAKLLIVWGPADEADAREIQRRCGGILAPEAALSRNIALLASCTAVVANDSGPMHLVSGCGVPILAIYGPTYPEGPYGTNHAWVRHEALPCLVCNLLHCPIQHPCMRELPLDAVLAKFDELLAKNS